MNILDKIKILDERILLLTNTINSVQSDIDFLSDLGYIPGEDNGNKQIDTSERIEHGHQYIGVCMLKISVLEAEKKVLTNQG